MRPKDGRIIMENSVTHDVVHCILRHCVAGTCCFSAESGQHCAVFSWRSVSRRTSLSTKLYSCWAARDSAGGGHWPLMRRVICLIARFNCPNTRHDPLTSTAWHTRRVTRSEPPTYTTRAGRFRILIRCVRVCTDPEGFDLFEKDKKNVGAECRHDMRPPVQVPK